MNVQISALICTRNRSSYLRKAIQSLVNQTLLCEQYEIVVVDNASEDDTPAVIAAFADVPNLVYIYEPVLGLSRARNAALKHARGEFVAFLDDDAVACPNWLEKYLEVFTTFKPTPGSVGGKCDPIWEAPQPAWLCDKMLTSLSVYDWSKEPMVLDQSQWVAGCNVAYPARVLREIGGFREDLGRVGKRLLAGEETYVRRQLDARGYVTVYHPDIRIGHHVSESRLNKGWFRHHAYGTGQSQAVMLKLDGPLPITRRAQLGAERLLWALPRLPLALAGNDANRFRREYQVIESLGYVSALLS